MVVLVSAIFCLRDLLFPRDRHLRWFLLLGLCAAIAAGTVRSDESTLGKPITVDFKFVDTKPIVFTIVSIPAARTFDFGDLLPGTDYKLNFDLHNESGVTLAISKI